MKTYISNSPQETSALGAKLAKNLPPGTIICLMGNLGSGKTTFVKGLAQGLNIPAESVNSPTFVLMNAYSGRLPLYHFDFYRLERVDEILLIGYEEFLYGDGVAVVEWAERLGPLLPQKYLAVHFGFHGQEKRIIKLTGHGADYQKFLEKLII